MSNEDIKTQVEAILYGATDIRVTASGGLAMGDKFLTKEEATTQILKLINEARVEELELVVGLLKQITDNTKESASITTAEIFKMRIEDLKREGGQ